MSTGVESWNTDLSVLGPLYPFVGTEVLLVAAGAVAWILWQVIQIRAENASLAQEEAALQDTEKPTDTKARENTMI